LNNKIKNKNTTVLSEIEPMSEDEMREFEIEQMKKWFEENTKTILAICDGWPDLAEKFCKQIADHFGPHPKLGPLIKSRIIVNREGSTKGKKKKFSLDMYELLLVTYTSYCIGTDRATALKETRKLMGLPSEAALEKHITKARKLLDSSKLPVLTS